MHAKGANGGSDAAIARLAANQHGVSLAQLERVGNQPPGAHHSTAISAFAPHSSRVFAVGIF
jgi:hypothetical protein